MHHRLTSQELFAIRRALAAGTRHVEIARSLNLSVWTIAKIKDDPLIQEDPIREDELPVDDAPADYVPENLRRCPGCGAMIYLSPCLACKMAVTVRVPPAEEVVDELEDMIGWDVAAIERRRRRDGAREGRREVALAGCGRRRRTKRGNLAYRVKMARAEVRS